MIQIQASIAKEYSLFSFICLSLLLLITNSLLSWWWCVISCHICFNQVGQLAQMSRLHRDANARQQQPLVRHSVADIMPGKIWLTCIAIVTFFEFQSSAINPNHFGSILEAHPQFRAHQQKRPFWLTNWINNDYEDNDVGKNFDLTYFTEVLFSLFLFRF